MEGEREGGRGEKERGREVGRGGKKRGREGWEGETEGGREGWKGRGREWGKRREGEREGERERETHRPERDQWLLGTCSPHPAMPGLPLVAIATERHTHNTHSLSSSNTCTYVSPW